MNEPVVTTEVIAPDIAKVMLSKTKINRRIIQGHVIKLAREMSAGNWRLTHEGIAFNARGDLIDGQHRLAAIVKSNVSVRCLVFRGVSNDTMLAVDCGKSRTVYDVLRICGEYKGIQKTHISCARAMMGYKSFGGTADLATTREIGDFWRLHEESIRYASTKMHHGDCVVNCAAVCSVLARAYYHVERPTLDEFCEVLRFGVSTKDIHANLILFREFLIKSKIVRSAGTRKLIRGKMSRAIVACVNREILGRLYVLQAEPFLLPEEAEQQLPNS